MLGLQAQSAMSFPEKGAKSSIEGELRKMRRDHFVIDLEAHKAFPSLNLTHQTLCCFFIGEKLYTSDVYWLDTSGIILFSYHKFPPKFEKIDEGFVESCEIEKLALAACPPIVVHRHFDDFIPVVIYFFD